MLLMAVLKFVLKVPNSLYTQDLYISLTCEKFALFYLMIRNLFMIPTTHMFCSHNNKFYVTYM